MVLGILEIIRRTATKLVICSVSYEERLSLLIIWVCNEMCHLSLLSEPPGNEAKRNNRRHDTAVVPAGRVQFQVTLQRKYSGQATDLRQYGVREISYFYFLLIKAGV
jgi:hypothetical protein